MEPPPARDLLGYTLALTTSDPGLTDYVDRLSAAFPVAEAADHRYSVEPDDDGRFVFLVDGEQAGSADHPEGLVQIPPAAIRADAVGAPCPVAFVVFLDSEAGAATELVPLTRGEALVELAKNTFRFDQEGRPSLEVLAAVVRGAEVYRLPNGSLDEAVACITGLVGG